MAYLTHPTFIHVFLFSCILDIAILDIIRNCEYLLDVSVVIKDNFFVELLALGSVVVCMGDSQAPCSHFSGSSWLVHLCF